MTVNVFVRPLRQTCKSAFIPCQFISQVCGSLELTQLCQRLFKAVRLNGPWMWQCSLQLGSLSKWCLSYVYVSSICFVRKSVCVCVSGQDVGMNGTASYGGSKSPQWALSCEGNTLGKRWMQSSSLWSDVINYLAIDPWVSGILCGPPSHIHQASSLQLILSGNASNTHSSPESPPQHGLLLRYNTGSYLYEEWIELEGLHCAPRYCGILVSLSFLI